MTQEHVKYAALGGVVGAALAVAIVFASATFGFLPGAGDNYLHGYLMGHPDVLLAMTEKLQAQDDDNDIRKRQAAVDKVGLRTIFASPAAFVTGPADAKTTFIEFFDYNCVHCRASFPAVRKFYEAHKNDTRFAFIEFPINGPQSTAAARAALAAHKQPDKYVALHFALMSEEGAIDQNLLYTDAKKAGLDMARLTSDVGDPAIDKAIDASHALAKKAAVDGTPTFIINGKVHIGEVTDAILNQMAKG